MPPIRVLAVDDSVVIRKILTDALSADPELEIVGTAPDGRIAVAKIPQTNPDLITMDVEMPVMNGLEALAEIRKQYPKLPVIMFSTLTERGASATLEALSLGASDYVTKPSNVGSPLAAIARVRLELIPKIKALCPRLVSVAKPSPKLSLSPVRVTVPVQARPRQRIDVLAIGTSTGGPNALATVIPALPADLAVPVVIVQHMPPIFTRLLAERLSTHSRIRVVEAESGQVLRPGTAWIAPGDYHMTLRRSGGDVSIELNQNPPENSCRPSVDVLFRSVAQLYGSHALGLVMTGMGADGVRGSERIREAGSEVIVQDEASSVVWGMPGMVAAAGQADGIYPLDALAQEVTRRVQQSRAMPGMVRAQEKQGAIS